MLYRIFGYVPSQTDDNSAVDEGAPGQPASLPEVVIYETGDREEAMKIIKAGGYIDENNQWYAASRVVTEHADDGGNGPATPRKSK
jgi:hypothetical protein